LEFYFVRKTKKEETMNYFRRTIAVIMSGIMLASTGAIAVSAAETTAATVSQNNDIVEGTGDNVWSFNKKTGELKIKKIGDREIFYIDDESSPGDYLPWKKYVKDIKTATIGKDVTGVYDGCFSGCENLTQVNLPETLKFIGYCAFSACSSLKSITLPESVTEFDSFAFFNASALESIVIPKNVTKIGAYAFSNCRSLKSVKLLAEMKELPSDCFSRCSSLTDVELPDSIEEFSNQSVFSDCTSLKTIKLPANLKYLGERSFECCTKLENIVIPDTVEQIGYNCFRRCKNLKSINIPDKVTTISDETFKDCTKLAEIKGGKNVDFIFDTSFINTPIYNNPDNWTDGVLYILNCLVIANKNTPKDYVIKDGTKLITEKAFNNLSSLESVVIPDSVEMISGNAFSKCENLKSVKFGEGIKIIDGGAFKGCVNLTEINLPDSLEDIKRYAFKDCKNLTKVTLGNNVKRIEWGAFVDCKKLTSVVIPKSVEEIEEAAFYTDAKSFTVIGYKDSTAQKYAKKEGLKFQDIETGEAVDYVKENPVKIHKKAGKKIKAKSLKKKNCTIRAFDADNCRPEEIKASVVKKGTSKLLRNRIKVINVVKGTITFKKGTYKKGNYKLKLKFKVPAYLGCKSTVVTADFKIKIY
jgi:hypothetical protein